MTNHIAMLNLGNDGLLYVNGQHIATLSGNEFLWAIGDEQFHEVDLSYERIWDLDAENPQWMFSDAEKILTPEERKVLGITDKDCAVCTCHRE
jgi:hypothetical protein